MIDYRYETFIKVADLLNFTKAAQALNMTQPTVSQHIAYVEEQSGLKLFLYRKNKLSLTNDGKELYLLVKEMLAYREKGYEELQKLHERNYQIMISNTIQPSKVMEILDTKTELKNKIYTIKQTTACRFLEDIKKIPLDFLITDFPVDLPDFTTYEIETEKIIAICSKGFYRESFKRIQDMKTESLLLREPTSPLYQQIRTYLRTKGLTFSDFSEIDIVGETRLILQLLEHHRKISFLEESSLREYQVKAEDFLIFDFSASLPSIPIYFSTKKDSILI